KDHSSSPVGKLRKITARKQQLKITYQDIGKLKLDGSNPRLHGPEQLKKIARSIEAFGFNVPVLVDEHRRVIAGHGRLAACALIGLKTIPTISLAHLTAAQARAFMLA